MSNHIERSISSSIAIKASAETVWEHITNVKLQQYSDPFLFKVLGIPKPLRADMLVAGNGGQRMAYFDNGKRFIQQITTWKPLQEYGFNFNPEKGFIVGHFLDLSDGVFRVPQGMYLLTLHGVTVNLKLSTTYSIDRKVYPIFNMPARIILKAFQRYLLRSIKRNCK